MTLCNSFIKTSGPGAGPEWTSLHYMDLGTVVILFFCLFERLLCEQNQIIFDFIDTGTWLKRKGMGREVPSLRSDFAYTNVKDKMLIFGGLVDPKTNATSNELYLLDIKGLY